MTADHFDAVQRVFEEVQHRQRPSEPAGIHHSPWQAVLVAEAHAPPLSVQRDTTAGDRRALGRIAGWGARGRRYDAHADARNDRLAARGGRARPTARDTANPARQASQAARQASQPTGKPAKAGNPGLASETAGAAGTAPTPPTRLAAHATTTAQTARAPYTAGSAAAAHAARAEATTTRATATTSTTRERPGNPSPCTSHGARRPPGSAARYNATRAPPNACRFSAASCTAPGNGQRSHRCNQGRTKKTAGQPA